VALAVLAAGVGLTAPDRRTAARPADATPEPPRPVGMVGCASANCHGKPGDVRLGGTPGRDAWQTSCTVWAAVDPHANAYAVLDPKRNEIAKGMQKALRKADPGFDPLTDARCLACHTDPSLANPPEAAVSKAVLAGLRAEGVGCEGCHGPAQRWQGPHTAWGKNGRARGIADTGMTELNDLGERAKACAGCHVGAKADPARGWPARDMNHDMIAAGHPRLAFEFATHQKRLPKHWFDRDRGTDASRTPGDEFRAWLVGQLAAGEAQCELSEGRMERNAAGEAWTPWPELAEWNCYSCHHNLLPASWRQTSYPAGRTPGRPGWDLPWPLSDRAAANALSEGLGDRVTELVGKLNPKAITAAPLADMKALAGVLRDARRRVVGMTADQAHDRMQEVLRTAAADRPLGWDDAYRVYLALVAKSLAGGPTVPPGVDALAGALGLPGHPTEQPRGPKAAREKITELVK
jgi:hypothetical protein